MLSDQETSLQETSDVLVVLVVVETVTLVPGRYGDQYELAEATPGSASATTVASAATSRPIFFEPHVALARAEPLVPSILFISPLSLPRSGAVPQEPTRAP